MDLSKVEVVLVDIEGTTTSISFVKDKLFPFVTAKLAEYVEKNWENDEFKGDLKVLKEQSDKDKEAGLEGLPVIEDDSKESVVKNVLWQMELDRKTTGLKQLQGHMWRQGYADGDLKGHVYPEVTEALRSWKKAGKKIYVYSSGSVEAQKLLFGHSIDGDLVELFAGFFDTAVGVKGDKTSYDAIAKEIALEPAKILFLTDVAKEAEAAREAGLEVMIVVREGNAALDDNTKKEFTIIRTLDEVVFEPSAKRAKIIDEKTDEIIKTTEPMETQPINETEEKPTEQEISEKPAKEEEEEKKKEKDEPEKKENGEEKPAEDEPVAEAAKTTTTNGEGKKNGVNGNSETVAVPVVDSSVAAEEPVVAKLAAAAAAVAVDAPVPIEVAAE